MTMYCPNCGKQNPDDAKFCESCGAPTGAAETPKAAPPPPPPQPQYSPPPPPPPVYAAPAQQQYYQQPPSYQAAGAGSGNTAPMSVGQFLGTIILVSIPLVGFILMLVWAFGSDVNQNKKNLSRAMLILMLIGIVLGIVMGGLLGGLIANLFDSAFYY
jgi:hypothetical protein